MIRARLVPRRRPTATSPEERHRPGHRTRSGRMTTMSDSVSTRLAARLPALYLGHGAPPLLDDPVWPGQLASWAGSLSARRPSS